MISDFANAVRAVPIRERIGGPIVILALAVFVGLGIDTIIHPRRYMRGYPGGEMRRELHETGLQIIGVVFAAAAALMLCKLAWSLWHDLFG